MQIFVQITKNIAESSVSSIPDRTFPATELEGLPMKLGHGLHR